MLKGKENERKEKYRLKRKKNCTRGNTRRKRKEGRGYMKRKDKEEKGKEEK